MVLKHQQDNFLKMKDSEPNIASTIKETYETLDRTREMINNYKESNALKWASEELTIIETDLSKISKEPYCWNLENCLKETKRQKELINTLIPLLQFERERAA